MKETVLTSVQEAYEPPFADIIEVAVEGGFNPSSGVAPVNYDGINGTEGVGRENVTDSWY